MLPIYRQGYVWILQIATSTTANYVTLSPWKTVFFVKL